MFRDRCDAGRSLADKLEHYRNHQHAIVLALPRGGVPVAHEVAKELNLGLDVFLVRKLGVPGQEELAMGAIASGGVRILNDAIMECLSLPSHVVEEVTAREAKELERREMLYRGGRPPANVRNRTVILIDDGLATGASMRAALAALRLQQPARIVVAVPIASSLTCAELRSLADEVVCADTPDPFYSVGQGYEKFDQTTDAEVQALLRPTG